MGDEISKSVFKIFANIVVILSKLSFSLVSICSSRGLVGLCKRLHQCTYKVVGNKIKPLKKVFEKN